ncbi:hypothetical protein V3G39_00215 [Dermatophilaceae bacterium Sec6.4]
MRITLARVAIASLSTSAVLGLAACGPGSAPSVAAPSSTSTSSVPTSSSSSPSSSTSSSAPSDTSTSSSSSSSTSASPSDGSTPQASGALPAGCTTKLSPDTATFKIGQPAVFLDSNKTTVCMTPTKLVVAPDSVYGGNIAKSGGTVYFLMANYANMGGGTGAGKVNASDINQYEFHPTFGAGQKGKTFFSSVPGCENNHDYDVIPVGKSQDTCIPFQITGAKVSGVEYDSYPQSFAWK